MTLSASPCFRTSDTALSAALVLHGLNPIGTDLDGRRLIFKFEDSAYLREVLSAYIGGSLTGSLRAYIATYKDLVSRSRTRKAHSKAVCRDRPTPAGMNWTRRCSRAARAKSSRASWV